MGKLNQPEKCADQASDICEPSQGSTGGAPLVQRRITIVSEAAAGRGPEDAGGIFCGTIRQARDGDA